MKHQNETEEDNCMRLDKLCTQLTQESPENHHKQLEHTMLESPCHPLSVSNLTSTSPGHCRGGLLFTVGFMGTKISKKSNQSQRLTGSGTLVETTTQRKRMLEKREKYCEKRQNETEDKHMRLEKRHTQLTQNTLENHHEAPCHSSSVSSLTSTSPGHSRGKLLFTAGFMGTKISKKSNQSQRSSGSGTQRFETTQRKRRLEKARKKYREKRQNETEEEKHMRLEKRRIREQNTRASSQIGRYYPQGTMPPLECK